MTYTYILDLVCILYLGTFERRLLSIICTVCLAGDIGFFKFDFCAHLTLYLDDEYLDSFNTFNAKQKFQRFEILVKLQLGFVWHKARTNLKFVATVMTGGRVKLFPTV